MDGQCNATPLSSLAQLYRTELTTNQYHANAAKTYVSTRLHSEISSRHCEACTPNHQRKLTAATAGASFESTTAASLCAPFSAPNSTTLAARRMHTSLSKGRHGRLFREAHDRQMWIFVNPSGIWASFAPSTSNMPHAAPIAAANCAVRLEFVDDYRSKCEFESIYRLLTQRRAFTLLTRKTHS